MPDLNSLPTDATILVTGAAGFIGSHLVDNLLAEGHTVLGIDNFNTFYDPATKRANLAPALNNPRFTLSEIDIRERQAVHGLFEHEQPAVVIHLAAMAGVRPSIESPSLYTAVNLDGTVNLLDAAAEMNDKPRFVFASSSSVYGNNKKVPFAEHDPVDRPISPYAATKRAGELIAHTYAHLHQLPVVALRFFTVFGPRQRPDLAIAKFLKLVADEQPIPVFGDGSTSRDYTYIDDIVAGVIAAARYCGSDTHTTQQAADTPDTAPRFDIFNLGGSDPVSLTQMIETVGQVVGKQPIIDRKPMQPGDVNRTSADITKSRTKLGYQPTTSLLEGITRQWNATQANEPNAPC
ncbi:GDP-mannose 4,6-dehydratase [Mucisphaera calidilacus]|uniref:UDP-glucose 4-epimerase n=1 Tax=Mucisphaera calidilacus TaxID=2527982 RepID=A0A518BTW9_9BACT|nr:GDP-mannose 4,6-dehydratase [Mucisphaera calidilacus]QDU70421.1 UDP-glucose 4-epimerase [Mucisphaera calidilacus]